MVIVAPTQEIEQGKTLGSSLHFHLLKGESLDPGQHKHAQPFQAEYINGSHRKKFLGEVLEY